MVVWSRCSEVKGSSIGLVEVVDFLALDAGLLFEAFALRFQALPDQHLRGHNAHQFTVGLRVLNRVYGSAHRVSSNREFGLGALESLNLFVCASCQIFGS